MQKKSDSRYSKLATTYGGHLLDYLLQEELQMALRVSSEEDVGGGAASDEDVHVVKPADKKKAGLGVVNEEGSIVLGDIDDEGNCLESGIHFPVFLFDVIILIRICASPLPQLCLNCCS